MGYNIIEFVSDKNGCIIGIILSADNGDTKYLTMLEYQTFVNNRLKSGFEDGNKAG
jgi:hypothetical protein